MANYRNISLGLWNDTKFTEDLSMEEKMVFLYLLTNSNTNLLGVYEIGINKISNELGMEKSKVQEALHSLEYDRTMICYAEQTREVYIINFSKYNWTKSADFIKAARFFASQVKDFELRELINEKLEKFIEEKTKRDTVPTPSLDGGKTTVTDTVSVSVSDTVSVSVTEKEIKKKKTSLDHLEDLRPKYPELEDERLYQAIYKWFEYKKAKTPKTYQVKQSAQSIISEIVNQSKVIGVDGVEKSVEKSIMQGWVGLFFSQVEPKQNKVDAEWGI